MDLLNTKPIGFMDIGARGGIHPLVEQFSEAVHVVGFEPDHEAFKELQRDLAESSDYARADIEPVGLFHVAGDHTLFELSAPTNSSLLQPNKTFTQRYSMTKWEEIGTSQIRTKTLDQVVFEDLATFDHMGEAIKIDTQGTEFEVLLGAQKTLTERTQFLTTEVSFCQLYQNQKLFSDIELFLRSFGFSFYGFDHIYSRSRGFLDKANYKSRERHIQADAIFFKDSLDHPLSSSANTRVEYIKIIFAIASGYYDLALELSELLKPTDSNLKNLILSISQISKDDELEELQTLIENVHLEPNEIAIKIGKFVDKRRFENDFFNV